MRADRLLSIIILLQSHSKLSAAELAKRLEVSERTIYRDIDALGVIGVPVYAEPGRGGGYGLLDSYHTNWSDLKKDELRALLILRIPEPLFDLEISQDFKNAFLKLSTTLSNALGEEERRVRQRFYLDSTWWRQGYEPIPHLKIIENAVWADHRLIIQYRPYNLAEIELLVDALGLVAKAGVWYFVFALKGRSRAIRVASLSDVKITDQTFERSNDFDLESFWQSWCNKREKDASNFKVLVRVAHHFIEELPLHFGGRIDIELASLTNNNSLDDNIIELSFESQEAARARLLSLGSGVEVLEPISLRHTLQDYAQQVLALYTK